MEVMALGLHTVLLLRETFDYSERSDLMSDHSDSYDQKMLVKRRSHEKAETQVICFHSTRI